jgi:hypothetical protein
VKRGLSTILGLMVALNVSAGCRPDSTAPGSAARDSYLSAYRGLCRSQAVVDEDLSRARDVFYSEAHSELHHLAEETAQSDRMLAAQLLEAKNRAESELAGASPEAAAASIEELLRVSREALISLGVPPQACDR